MAKTAEWKFNSTIVLLVAGPVRTYCRHDGCCVALLVNDNEPKELASVYIVDMMVVV